MSYEIEYKRKAYRLPKEEGSYESLGDELIVFVQEGSNNVYEVNWSSGRQKRARSWGIVSKGHEYSIIQDVCKRGAYCEGGSLVLSGRSRMTPENYIKLYRNLLKNAKPISEFFTDFNTKEFVINVKSDLGDYEKGLLKELKKDKKFKLLVEDDGEMKFIIDVNTLADLEKALSYRSLCRYNYLPSTHLTENTLKQYEMPIEVSR